MAERRVEARLAWHQEVGMVPLCGPSPERWQGSFLRSAALMRGPMVWTFLGALCGLNAVKDWVAPWAET